MSRRCDIHENGSYFTDALPVKRRTSCQFWVCAYTSGGDTMLPRAQPQPRGMTVKSSGHAATVRCGSASSAQIAPAEPPSPAVFVLLVRKPVLVSRLILLLGMTERLARTFFCVRAFETTMPCASLISPAT